MKNRTVIIIGIIMISPIPFVTFAVLERYDNYLEQLEYEAQRIANEPKPGERSYIEPELKARLEAAELDLREKVRQLHQGLPPSSYAVNLNSQTKEIEVFVENKQLIPEITKMITQYPDDISIVVSYGVFSVIDFLDDEIKPVYSIPYNASENYKVNPIFIEDPNNPGQLILDVYAMNSIQKILDKCTYIQKLESGEIPARNPDGSINMVTGELRFYNNGTHYIDNNICSWIDSLEAVTYNCFESNPMEQNWYFGPEYFDNGTHHIDVQACEWVTYSEEYLNLPLCDPNPEQNFGKCRELP